MIYIFNSVMIFVYAIMCRYVVWPDRKKVFLFLCMLQMTLIIGFRYQVGADYLTYERIYEELSIGYISNSGSRVEIGYRLLNILLGKIGIPFWGLNLLIAFLTNLFLGKSIYRLVEKYEYVVMAVYLYVAFFFFYHSMNMTRQGMAMCVGLYAITCFLYGEKQKGIFLILIASAVHVSAMMYVLILIIRKTEISKKTILAYIGASVVIEFGIDFIQRFLNLTKYAVYLDDYYNKTLLDSTILNLGIRFLMLILTLFAYKDIKKSECKNCLYNMVILCTLIQGLAVQSSIFGRVTTCFFIGYIILIPHILDNIRWFNTRLLYVMVIMMGTLYHIVYFISSWHRVLVNPYQSIFSNF